MNLIKTLPITLLALFFVSCSPTDNPPENNPPTASSVNSTTQVNQSVNITLRGSDADSDPLTYSVSTQPSNGSVSISNNVATYTPNTDYTGSDQFAYTVSDGTDTSSPANVSITVNAATVANRAPTANAQNATVAYNQSQAITLTATDADGDALTYSISTQPSNGTVSLSGAVATYTPNTNYSGSDSFQWQCDTNGAICNAFHTKSQQYNCVFSG